MMPLDDTARPQRRDDHQLRDLVQRTGDLTIATDLGVPRSTARGWLDAAPTVVVSLDWANLTEPAERRELLDASPHLQDLLSEFPVGAGPLADLRVQRAEPCLGRESLREQSLAILNDENSRGKVQNVRGDSCAGFSAVSWPSRS
jgi:hypothetical protein